jgi:hypothetical protein
MADAKPVRSPTTAEPLIRYTKAEVARNKKARDERRKSIRLQNANSRIK